MYILVHIYTHYMHALCMRDSYNVMCLSQMLSLCHYEAVSMVTYRFNQYHDPRRVSWWTQESQAACPDLKIVEVMQL